MDRFHERARSIPGEEPMRRRSGFTLVELLVVIAILLVLSTLAMAIFNTGKSSDRMRSGARVAQSAFLGAKDRALHAKDLRGVRLTRDQTNPNLVNGFVYLQALPLQSFGPAAIQLERQDLDGDGLADSPDITVVRGFDSSSPAVVPAPATNVNWTTLYNLGAFASPQKIRIPSGTGQWYVFTVNTSGPYQLKTSNECLVLQAPFQGTGVASPAVVAYNTGSGTTATCDIQLGNDVLPFHQPISLPSSCVIDLTYSSSNVLSLAGGVLAVPLASPAPSIDIMFSPRGMVNGPLSAQGPLHFCLRDLQDATSGLAPTSPNVRGDCLILSIFPQTGLVQTFPADLVSGNLFSFAQAGQSAGQ